MGLSLSQGVEKFIRLIQLILKLKKKIIWADLMVQK